MNFGPLSRVSCGGAARIDVISESSIASLREPRIPAFAGMTQLFFQSHFDKEGSHDESERRIACSNSRLRTIVGLRDLRHARKHRIRYLPPNGP